MKYTINELANSKGVSQHVREALLHMEAELTATNRQVEILSDALAESRREVAALKAVQEPVAAECKFDREQEWLHCEIAHHNLVQSEPHKWPGYQTRLLYTTPPAAQPAPVQEPVAWVSLQWLAEMILSDCGHSSNYTPLLDRVKARIEQWERANSAPTPPAQPAVPDALNPKDENPAYAAGWNDCRAAMMEMMK